jgi:predicted RNase H-like nuclease
MQVIGIDAWRAGWVAVELTGDLVTGTVAGPLRLGSVRLATTLVEITETFPEAAAIGVDMPMGLLAQGWRTADDEAARMLGAQRSRVFRVPPRAAITDGSSGLPYADAVSRCRELTDPPLGFSRQAWGLAAKIREADEIRAADHDRLFEVHPELSFAALAGGQPVAASKKTWNGQHDRRRLLTGAGIVIPNDLGPAGAAPADDILDAAAVAWTAARIARGKAAFLPESEQLDDRGQPIRIWY